MHVFGHRQSFRQPCFLLALLCCLEFGCCSKVQELTEKHFGQNAGQFEHHPVRGHTHAMVLFYDSNTSPVMLSELQVVARAIEARGLSERVMIAQLQGDTEQNKVLSERFNLNKLPFVALLTEGKADWQATRASRAQIMFKGLTKSLQLEPELQQAPKEKGVIQLMEDNFREHAGEFASHPLRGHKYALVMFYEEQTNAALLSEYEAVARTLGHLGESRKVMVARVNVDEKNEKYKLDNKILRERFELQRLPFFAWLTKDEQDWWAMSMRSTEDLVAQIQEKLGISKRKVSQEL